MATTNLNIRTDKEIKEAAEKIYCSLGLNMTIAINMFLGASIRE
ncbi:type II toxin-antitoxin system RelB/DinJ family antitoxin, partial [Peptoniphilus grossensis]